MKKVTIALIGASVLAVGLLGCSHKTEAGTNHHMMALVPIKNSSVSYDEVNVKSYSISNGMIHIITDEGIEYFGNNIVIEKWSD
ncbi:hypothetical protein [Streptococcus equinus]|uniref:hypothetical protein n=1 Tax=Streptococcus equinus TaxID=1335 RepID=UPI0015F44CA4|nr:hypothetical protein [Streptococcus equinus]QMS96929.1 hypothetical protein H1R75_03390 [Streptococcus equinus]